MTNKDMRAVARKLVDIGRRLDAQKAAQLPHTSITLDDGTAQDLADGATAAKDALDLAVGHDTHLVDVDDIGDTTVVESTFLPERIGAEAGSSDASFQIGIANTLKATEAMEAAEGAAELALEAKVTADGRNRIYAQAINPVAAPDFPFVNGDLWYRTEVVGGETRFVEVFMWNGTEWKPYQMVASSLLVPGSVGAVLIENGGITGPKIAGDAIDGKTITGATIRTAAAGRRFVMSGYSLDGYDESGIKRVTMYPSSAGLRLDSNDVAKYGTLNGDAFALNNFRTGQYDRAGFAALANRLHMTNIYPDPGGDPAKQGFVSIEGRAGWPSDDMTADFTVTARAPGLGSAGGEQDVRLYASSTESFIEIYAPGGSAKIARAKGGTETVYTGPTFSFQAPVKYQGDTDWAFCTLLNGTQMQGGVLPEARIRDGRIQLRWGVSGTGIGANAARIACRMPNSIAPTANRYATAPGHSAASACMVVVTSGGDIEVRTGATAPNYIMFDQVNVPL